MGIINVGWEWFLEHGSCENFFAETVSHMMVLHRSPETETSSSAMAERPRELDQRFQMGGQFEAIID